MWKGIETVSASFSNDWNSAVLRTVLSDNVKDHILLLPELAAE